MRSWPIRSISVILFAASSLFGCAPDTESAKPVVPNTAVSAAADQPLEGRRALTRRQAISLAESFLEVQGYTDRPTDLELSQVVFEPGEYATDVEKLLDSRQNLLQLPAYGARRYGENRKWAVGFKYVNEVDNIGRGVSMDSLGGNVRLDPSEIRLDWIDEGQPGWRERQRAFLPDTAAIN